MIIISGTMQFQDAAERTAMLEAFGPLQAATRDEEPGCIAYAFSPDPLHDDTVLIYEHWESAEALDAHFRHPNFANAGRTIGGFKRLATNMQKYHVDKAGPIFVDGRPSTVFP